MNLTEKTLKKEYQYQGKILKMRVDEVELPNGNTAKREVVEHPGGVTIAALTDDNELLFVRQFRYPYETVLLELPAGKLDPGENQPLEAAKRELQEETGAVGKDYISLGTFYPSAGFCDEVLHLYFCKVASIGASHPDEDEFIEPILIPIKKFNRKKRKRRYIYLRFSFLYIISVNLSLSFQIFWCSAGKQYLLLFLCGCLLPILLPFLLLF